MDAFLKMDVFFVVATIGVVVVSALLAGVLWYALRLMRTLDRISKEVESEVKLLRKDLDTARLVAKREGKAVTSLIDFALRTGRRLLGLKH